MSRIVEEDTKIVPLDVARYFLSKSSLSPKKIQKLVYYAYAWFIALNNQNADQIENILFDEQPEAWLHGPVFPTLYTEYRSHGWNEVSRIRRSDSKLDKEVKQFLDEIWRVFGGFTADQLEYMTHQETPWRNARNGVPLTASSNNKISNKDIFIYYNELAQK